jgi:hypothetical protein
MSSRSAFRCGIFLLTLGLLACDAEQRTSSAQDPAVSITPGSATLPPAGEQVFAAAVNGLVNTSVTWAITEGAAGGRVTDDGSYTAPSVAGTYHVVVTSTADTSKSATATVTVTSEQGAPPIATSHGIAIPSTHPRLWFSTPALLAQGRTWYAAHPYTPSNDTSWEWNYPGWTDTAMRGLLNNEASQCNAAITAATTGVIRAAVFPTSGTACDQCRWFGEQAIMIFDWCYNFMTPSQRSSYIAAHNPWVRYWLTEANGDWGEPPMHQNNYYWGYTRNAILWAITTYGENPDAETILSNAIDTRLVADFFPATLTDSRGGATIEGTQYGQYMVGYTPLAFRSADLLGRDLYSESNFYKESVYWHIYATTPAPSYSNNTGESAPTLWPHGEDEDWTRSASAIGSNITNFMGTAAVKWANVNVGRHARQWLAMTGATPSRFVQAVDPQSAALAFTGLPLDYYAAGARWFYGRNAWGPTATTFVLQMGDRDYGSSGSTGHTQEDFGSWQMWRNGRFISRESVGYGEHTGETIRGKGGSGSVPTTHGLAHNTLLVDGGSISGMYQTARAVTVPRLEYHPDYSFAVANLTPLRSRPDGNPAFVSLQREFVFVRALETLVVFDRVESASASAIKTFVNHCETSPTTSGNNSATCTSGTQALVMTTLLPASRTYTVVNEGTQYVGQYRIEVDTTPGTAQSYVLTVLQAKDAGAASLSPSVVDNGTSYTVTLNASNSITFEKGMASSGGSIRTASGTRAFRSDIQRMTVGDGGPLWQ